RCPRAGPVVAMHHHEASAAWAGEPAAQAQVAAPGRFVELDHGNVVGWDASLVVEEHHLATLHDAGERPDVCRDWRLRLALPDRPGMLCHVHLPAAPLADLD